MNSKTPVFSADWLSCDTILQSRVKKTKKNPKTKQAQKNKKVETPHSGHSTPREPGLQSQQHTDRRQRRGRVAHLCWAAGPEKPGLFSWLLWGVFSDCLIRTRNKPTQIGHLISPTGSHVSTKPLPTITRLPLFFGCLIS